MERPYRAGRKPRYPKRERPHGIIPICRRIFADYPQRHRRFCCRQVHANHWRRGNPSALTADASRLLPDFGEAPRRQGAYRKNFRIRILQGNAHQKSGHNAGQGFRTRIVARRFAYQLRRPPGRNYCPRHKAEPYYHRRARHRKDNRHRVPAVETLRQRRRLPELGPLHGGAQRQGRRPPRRKHGRYPARNFGICTQQEPSLCRKTREGFELHPAQAFKIQRCKGRFHLQFRQPAPRKSHLHHRRGEHDRHLAVRGLPAGTTAQRELQAVHTGRPEPVALG